MSEKPSASFSGSPHAPRQRSFSGYPQCSLTQTAMSWVERCNTFTPEDIFHALPHHRRHNSALLRAVAALDNADRFSVLSLVIQFPFLAYCPDLLVLHRRLTSPIVKRFAWARNLPWADHDWHGARFGDYAPLTWSEIMEWYDRCDPDITRRICKTIHVERQGVFIHLNLPGDTPRHALVHLPAWSIGEVAELMGHLIERMEGTDGTPDQVFDLTVDALRELVGPHVTVDGEENEQY